MAKDGTMRGGAKPGLGRPKKALSEKILEGKAKTSLQLGDCKIPEMEADFIPAVEQYMKDEQHNGIQLRAEEVFKQVWLYLKEYGCENKVQMQLLNQYAMSTARWIQCEIAVSKYGMLAKHPTTGLPMTSPYVTMSREYNKQMTTLWYQIYQVIRDNSENGIAGNPQDNMMEKLLLTRKA